MNAPEVRPHDRCSHTAPQHSKAPTDSVSRLAQTHHELTAARLSAEDAFRYGEATIAHRDTTITQLRAQVAELSAALTTARAEATAPASQVAELTALVEQLRKERRSLRSALTRAQNKADALSELAAQAADLKRDRRNLRSALTRAEKRLRALAGDATA